MTADRHWNCTDLAERVVNRFLERYGPNIVIIHGGACGVNEAFAKACRKLGVVAEPQLAQVWGGAS